MNYRPGPANAQPPADDATLEPTHVFSCVKCKATFISRDQRVEDMCATCWRRYRLQRYTDKTTTADWMNRVGVLIRETLHRHARGPDYSP